MTTPDLRRAVPDDAPALARVQVQSWAETYRGLMPDDFLTVMTSEARRERRQTLWRQTLWRQTLEADKEGVLVAIRGGELVGFTSGGPTDFAGYDAELFTLYLLRSAQGSGVGRALVSALAQGLASGGHRSLMLWVLDVNPTRAFYEHLGGVVIGEKTEPVPGGELREVAYGWAELEALF